MVRQYIALAYNVMRLNNLTVEELSKPEVFYRLATGGLSKMTDQLVQALNNKAGDEVQQIVSKMNKK